MKKKQKAQVLLEITLVFVALLLFFVGMLNIWFWFNNDLVKRQKDYISSRDQRGRWPIHEPEIKDEDIF